MAITAWHLLRLRLNLEGACMRRPVPASHVQLAVVPVIVLLGACAADEQVDGPLAASLEVVTDEPDGPISTALAACSPQSPGEFIDFGVTYYDCSGSDPAVHVVTVDRFLPATEIRLLMNKRPGDANDSVRLFSVDGFAKSAGAFVAINGYNWDGPEGFTPGCDLPFSSCPTGDTDKLAIPSTTTFNFFNQLTGNRTENSEALMGFSRGGPSGFAARWIDHPRDDDSEFNHPDNLPFRYQMYGSEQSVIRPLEGCQSGSGENQWSVVGYSDTQVVFMSTESGNEYDISEFCSTLANFGVVAALRNDGGGSTNLWVGGAIFRVVNPLVSFFSLNNPSALLYRESFRDGRQVAYAVAAVPRVPDTFCESVVDGTGTPFASLCVTIDNIGYHGKLIMLDDAQARCGVFQFNMVYPSGIVLDDPSFSACSGSGATHESTFSFPLERGGCADLHLVQLSGHDFGFTEWHVPTCGEPGGPVGGPDPGPGPEDTSPPTTTASLGSDPNSSGWNRSDVTITFNSVDTGTVVSGVAAIHVSLSGAHSRSFVIPGSSGSVTVSAEGVTHVSYFAIDNAGNREAANVLTLRIDKTPPEITGLPGPDCSLWPPNHRLVEVATVSASDTVSGMAAFDVGVTSNEPEGNHGPVFTITGSGLQARVVHLRAEREGRGTGRVYTIAAEASDIAGNVGTATGTCTVPHDQGN